MTKQIRETSDIFWTDARQAIERLSGTVVMYDGEPVYISNVEDHGGEDIRARCTFVDGMERRKKLNSPKFKKFRDLPPLGWFNNAHLKQATFCRRTTISTRSHGLSSNNVFSSQIDFRNGTLTAPSTSIETFYVDKGYLDMVKGNFPTMSAILKNISENQVIAYSALHAIYKDSKGLVWVYRKDESVGIITGGDTLNLFPKMMYLREEFMDDPLFTLDIIREL